MYWKDWRDGRPVPVSMICRKVFHRRQKKRFKDSLNTSLKLCGVEPNAWEDLASDSPTWHNKVHSGVTEFEEQRINNAVQKRQQHKERACNPPPPGKQFHPCQSV